MANYDLSTFERNGNTYTYRSEIPIASSETLGGIKVGQNLSIDPTTGVLSADGGSNVEDLDDLSDVTLTSPSDGQVLKYDNGTWVNANDNQGIPTSEKGAANGVATLNSSGIIPSSQLPSYVDDIIEGYLYNGAFYEDNAHQTLITPETGKIYVDLDTDTEWRWGGSVYAQISKGLALGETSSTAYAGDKGKANADAILAIKDGVSIDSFGDVESALSEVPSALDDLTDVSIDDQTLDQGQILKYNGTAWVNDDESGGTTVVANPSGTATADLEKIQIGSTIYDIVGSGEVSGKSDVLYKASSTSVPSIITLLKSLTDYDYIITHIKSANSNQATIGYIYTVDAINIGDIIGGELAAGDGWIWYTYTNSTTFTYLGANNNYYIEEISGVKFDGGSGSGGEMAALDTTERTDLNTPFPLSDAITNYDAILVNIYYSGGSGYPVTGSTVLSVAELADHSYTAWIDGGSNDRALEIEFTDSTHYQIISSNGGNGVHGVYGIKFGSGTEVIPNPQETPTDTLETIKIGNTVYDIAGTGGSGSGYSRTTLYNTEIALPAQVTLSDDITNFDIIEITISYESINKGKTSFYYDAKRFAQDFPYVASPDGINTPHFVISDYYPQYARFIMGDANNKLWCYQSSNGYLIEVAGIKFGSGGPSAYSSEAIYTNSGTSVTDIVLSKAYTEYDSLYFECIRVADNRDYIVPYYMSIDDLNNGYFQLFGYSEYCSFYVTDSTHFTKINNNGDWYIKKIYGIKYGSGGGSGNLTAVELTQAEYDELTPEEKNDTSKIYFITDGTGGGGSSYSVEDIYTGTSRQTTMQLSKTIDNFDAIEIEISWLYSNKIYQYSIITSTDRILNSSADYYCLGYNNYRYVELAFTNNSTITWNNGPDNIEYVSKVKGIKYGSSNTEDTEVPSYIETTIYESSTDENTYNLSQPITDFDAIVIMAQYTGQVNNAIISRTFLSSEMIEYIGTDNRFELASDSNYIWVGITDASTFTKKAQFDFKVIKIVGINYGLGKGIGKNAEIIPITNPTDTASRTFTFSKTPKRIAASYNSSDSWYGFWNFIWGDEWAQFTCKAKSTGVANPQSGLSQITYGSDGKSFTITGANSFQALNSSGGYGQMYVDYGESNNQLQEDYSLTEQRIGTWIDNKPIYRIVLQPWRAGTIQTGYSILNSILTTPLYGNINIDTIVDTKLLNHRTDNSGYTDIFVSSQAFMGQAIVPNKNGTFYIGDISYLGDVDIILDYTKVTI